MKEDYLKLAQEAGKAFQEHLQGLQQQRKELVKLQEEVQAALEFIDQTLATALGTTPPATISVDPVSSPQVEQDAPEEAEKPTSSKKAKTKPEEAKEDAPSESVSTPVLTEDEDKMPVQGEQEPVQEEPVEEESVPEAITPEAEDLLGDWIVVTMGEGITGTQLQKAAEERGVKRTELGRALNDLLEAGRVAREGRKIVPVTTDSVIEDKEDALTNEELSLDATDDDDATDLDSLPF